MRKAIVLIALFAASVAFASEAAAPAEANTTTAAPAEANTTTAAE